jgi:hypothetical protein
MFDSAAPTIETAGLQVLEGGFPGSGLGRFPRRATVFAQAASSPGPLTESFRRRASVNARYP